MKKRTSPLTRFGVLLQCILLIHLSSANGAQAAYVIRSPDATAGELSEFLVSREDAKPWRDAPQAYHATAQDKERLAQLMEQAQRAFLTESLDSAAEQFRKVTDLAMSAQWDEVSRNSINFAFYRLAQLSENPEQKSDLLRQALVFRQALVADKTLFPPPMLAQAKQLKDSLDQAALSWEPAKTFRGFDSVNINGRVIPIRENLKVALWPGQYRVSAVSNMHAPFSQVISAADLVDLRLNRKSLLSGHCSKPGWTAETPTHSDLIALYEDGCAYQYRSGSWVKLPSPWPKLQLAAAVAPQASALTPAQSLETPVPEHRPWYKNKWVWIGVGVVAVGVTVAILARPKDKPQPSKETSVVPTSGPALATF